MFLDPQDEVGPSISSSVVLCFFFLLVYIVVFGLVVCLCPAVFCIFCIFLSCLFSVSFDHVFIKYLLFFLLFFFQIRLSAFGDILAFLLHWPSHQSDSNWKHKHKDHPVSVEVPCTNWSDQDIALTRPWRRNSIEVSFTNFK